MHPRCLQKKPILSVRGTDSGFSFLAVVNVQTLSSHFKTLLRVLFECTAHGVLVREEKVR